MTTTPRPTVWEEFDRNEFQQPEPETQGERAELAYALATPAERRAILDSEHAAEFHADRNRDRRTDCPW